MCGNRPIACERMLVSLECYDAKKVSIACTQRMERRTTYERLEERIGWDVGVLGVSLSERDRGCCGSEFIQKVWVEVVVRVSLSERDG